MASVDLADGDVVILPDQHQLNVDSVSQYMLMGKPFPRSEVRFFAQVIILYLVIITCLANLTFAEGRLDSLWVSLMSTSIGILVPSPYISQRLQTSTGTTSPVAAAAAAAAASHAQ